MAEDLQVYRYGAGEPVLIGALDADGSFSYAEGYAANPDNLPVSVSLPIRNEAFAPIEAKPFFEGLVPEGAARTLMASELHVREDDWLSMLASCGLDCVGDLLITAGSFPSPPTFEPVSTAELKELFSRRASMAELNGSDRLSLAGTQSKVGLAHVPNEPLVDGWMRAKNCAASTHILKVGSRDRLTNIEFLCTSAAARCGIDSAKVDLLDFGVPVLCSKRFDRICRAAKEKDPNALQVTRLHQEDMAQAFAVDSRSKYVELEGGSLAAIARLLREESDDAVADIRRLAKLVCFNYAIGNCDAHLKNFSLLYGEHWDTVRLAPAYDLVCTTWFEDLSRSMAMAINGVWNIDCIRAEDFRACARDFGLSEKAFAAAAHEVAEAVDEAILVAGSEAGEKFEDVAWDAETLLEDIAPRKLVLSRV